MRQRDHNDQITQVHHKEEGTARIKLDTADHRILQVLINPLSETDYPKDLVNIVTGQVVSNKSINVDNAFQIGSKQMESFEGGWPETFHQTIHRSVVTMAIDRKHIQVADSKVYDTEIVCFSNGITY